MATRLKEIDWSKPVDPVVFRRAWEAGWRGMPALLLLLAFLHALITAWDRSPGALLLVVLGGSTGLMVVSKIRVWGRERDWPSDRINRYAAAVVVPLVFLLLVRMSLDLIVSTAALAAGAAALILLRPPPPPALPAPRCARCEYGAPDRVEPGQRCPECALNWSNPGALTYRPRRMGRYRIWFQRVCVIVGTIVVQSVSLWTLQLAVRSLPTSTLIEFQSWPALRTPYGWSEIRTRQLTDEQTRELADVVASLRQSQLSRLSLADLWLLEQYAAGRVEEDLVWRRVSSGFRAQLSSYDGALYLSVDPLANGLDGFVYGGAIGAIRVDGEDRRLYRDATLWSLGAIESRLFAPEFTRVQEALSKLPQTSMQGQRVELELWLIGWTGLASPTVMPLTWDAEGNLVPRPPIVWARKIVLRLEKPPIVPGTR